MNIIRLISTLLFLQILLPCRAEDPRWKDLLQEMLKETVKELAHSREGRPYLGRLDVKSITMGDAKNLPSAEGWCYGTHYELGVVYTTIPDKGGQNNSRRSFTDDRGYYFTIFASYLNGDDAVSRTGGITISENPRLSVGYLFESNNPNPVLAKLDELLRKKIEAFKKTTGLSDPKR